MDEPNNHLDIEAVNAFALNYFTGGLVIVSHDQHFFEFVCNKIVIVSDRKVTEFKGSFINYKKVVKSRRKIK